MAPNQRTEIVPSVDLASGVIALDCMEYEAGIFNLNEVLVRHHIEVLKTKDQAIRQALIALGWTPPADG